MMWILRVLLVAFLMLPLSIQPLAANEQVEVATITGRITSDVNGLSIPGAEVILIDPDAPDEEIVAATADLSGVYTVTQPISNTWKIKFVQVGYNPNLVDQHIAEYYNDVYTLEEATLITAEVGTLTENINASLATIGQVTGRVTSEATGQPIGNVYVTNSPGTGIAYTDSRGYYTFTTNVTGTQKLRFDPPDLSGYAIEYYNNQTNWSEAESIIVGEGRDLRDVDVSLTPGGMIKGTMTSTWRDQFFENPRARAYNEDGELIQAGGRFVDDPSNQVVLEPPGHYTIYNLPPGNYQLTFNADQHAPAATTELIQVEAGEVTSDINAQLTLSVTVSSIATSPAISETILLAFAHSPSPVLTIDDGKSWQVLSSSTWIQDSTLFAYPDRYSYHYMSVGVAPRGLPGEGTRLLAVIGDTAGDYSIYKGFYRSGDYGLSWAGSDSDTPIPPNCGYITQSRLYVSPLTPAALYLVYLCSNNYDARLLVSNNAGVTWHDVTVLEGRSLALTTNTKVFPSPTVENRLYLYHGNPYSGNAWGVSNDGGYQWETKDYPVHSLALDAANANYLYGWMTRPPEGYNGVGKRSRDGGNSWENWPEQPCPFRDGDESLQLLAHPTQPQLLFLRCDNNISQYVGIYRSDNGGDSWQKLESEIGQLLAIDYSNPGRLLWARDDGLFASTENGESWQALIQDYRIFARPLYLPNVSVNNP